MKQKMQEPGYQILVLFLLNTVTYCHKWNACVGVSTEVALFKK